jgi:hypothetical protein
MADNIEARLSADNSAFKAALSQSVKEADKFAGELTAKLSGKLFGLRDISNAISTALGLNFQSIGEKVAMIWTGMSKEVLDAYKQLDAVGTQVADANIKNMRAMLSEEQVYLLNLKDRDRLQNQIDNSFDTRAPAQLAMKQAELKLAEKTGEILAYEKKQRDELAKSMKESSEKQMTAAEKTVQTQIDTLSGAEKIAELKYNIAATEAVLASGSLDAANTEKFRATLAERKNQLTTEEAKVKDASSQREQKHQQRMEEATAKEIEDKRELLTVHQQMAKLRDDEAGWTAVMADMSASQEVRDRAAEEREKVRDKMRDLGLKKKKEEVELATLLLKPADQLTESEKLRLQVLQGTVTQKQLDQEKTTLLAGLTAGTLTEAEKNRLRVLMDQAAVLTGQLETAKAITTTVNRTGKGYDSQSDDNLLGVQQRLQADTQRLQRDRFGQIGGVGTVGGLGPSSEEYMLQNELYNLEKEMGERKEVRDYANRFGESKTRQKFGDTLTDKAMRDFTDQQARSTTALEDMQQRLAKLFPKT